MKSAANPHRVACLAFADAQILDISGPMEVFGRAARWLRDEGRYDGLCYELEIIAGEVGPVRTSSGLQIVATRPWRECEPDTLLVAGGIGWEQMAADPELGLWLRGLHARGRRIASICSGALILAAAGLLDGKRATTHWDYCDRLRGMAPDCEVSREAIYVQADERLYSSAGVTAGMDLALALVEHDHDLPTALAVAQLLVMFVKRPGGHPQLSRTLLAQGVPSDRLKSLQIWMLDHLSGDLSIESLAQRAAMSPRNFIRKFSAENGIGPARFVEQLRAEAACRRLEETTLPLARIATQVGLGSAETLRRVFQRQYGMAPAEFRRRLGAKHPPG